MNIVSKLIQIAVLALFLAFYQVLIQPLYKAWLESQGKILGVPEAMLANFLVLVAAWFLGIFVVRRMRREE